RAEELLGQLESVATPSGGTTPTQTAPIRALVRRPFSRGLIVAGVVIGAALMYWLWPVGRAPQIEIGRRAQVTRDVAIEYDPVLSPDDRFVAYTVPVGGGTRIVVRQVDGSAPVTIAPEGPV